MHPVIILLLQHMVSSLTVAYVAPSSPWRLASLPLQMASCGVTISTSRHYMRPFWAALCGGLSAVFLFQFLELCFFHKRQCEPPARSFPGSSASQSNAETRAHPAQLLRPFLWGFAEMCDFRRLNSPDEAKNSPRFSEQDHMYVPSRRRFLAVTGARLVICYVVLDMISSQPPPGSAIEDFHDDKIPFFARLHVMTTADLGLRVASTIAPFICSYCFLSTIYYSLAFCCVGLHMSDPKSWRPLFGSPRDAYSIRRFWGCFWHQNLRIMLSSPAEWMTDLIVIVIPKLRLRLRHDSPSPSPKSPPHDHKHGAKAVLVRLVSRYLRILFVFFLSGIIHHLADMAGDIPWSKSRTLQYFVWQAVGIMFEDTVEALSLYMYLFLDLYLDPFLPQNQSQNWRQNQHQHQQQSQKPRTNTATQTSSTPSAWSLGRMRMIGYLWTLAYLIWTTPLWVYPGAHHAASTAASVSVTTAAGARQARAQGIVPFSFFPPPQSMN